MICHFFPLPISIICLVLPPHRPYHPFQSSDFFPLLRCSAPYPPFQSSDFLPLLRCSAPYPPFQSSDFLPLLSVTIQTCILLSNQQLCIFTKLCIQVLFKHYIFQLIKYMHNLCRYNTNSTHLQQLQDYPSIHNYYH